MSREDFLLRRHCALICLNRGFLEERISAEENAGGTNANPHVALDTFGLFLSYPDIRIIFQSPPRRKYSIRILNSVPSQLF